MPDNNKEKKAHNHGADRSVGGNKTSVFKEALGGYTEAKNVEKASNSRRQVDNTIDGGASKALQGMGVPKGVADRAIKDNGGKFAPGNSPVNKFIKNKSRDALSKGLDRVKGNSNGSDGNFGKNLLNNMGNRVRPNGANNNSDKIKKMAQIAKRIPIPQVQAAAKVAEAASKTGLLDKKNKDNSDDGGNSNNRSLDITGMFAKRKLIMISIGLFFPVLLFLVVISSIVSGSSSTGGSMNEGLCVVDQDFGDECDEASDEAKEFYARVKEVKKEFDSNGKTFNPVYIAGFYFSLMSSDVDIDYDDLTKGKIEDIANAMFKGDSGVFDEDTFKANLKTSILPQYISDADESKYDTIIDDIFEYVQNFKSVYGDDIISSGTSFGARLVEIAVAELDDSNTSKHGGAKYWQYMGFNSRVHWCACFVSWVANQAGVDKSVIPSSASVETFYSYYKTAGNFHDINSGYTPQPGDLIIWEDSLDTNAKGWSHIGIVERYDSSTGKLYTIEGNSSDSVARNIYNDLGGCTGFASPNYPITNLSNFSGSNNAEKAWNFFRSKNVSKETTSAILGNLRQESGIDPAKLQYGGGPGRGIAQWEAGSSRYNMLVLYANRAKKSWDSLEVQLEFLWYELDGGEATTKFIMNRDYGGFNSFIKSNNIEWAVEAFEKSFERAGKPNMENRKKFAHEFYQQYGGK